MSLQSFQYFLCNFEFYNYKILVSTTSLYVCFSFWHTVNLGDQKGLFISLVLSVLKCNIYQIAGDYRGK